MNSPVVTGVYFLFKDRELIYCGRSENVYQRINDHKKNGRKFDYAAIISLPITDIAWVESLFIRGMNPEGNRAGNNNWFKEPHLYPVNSSDTVTTKPPPLPPPMSSEKPRDPNIIITIQQFAEMTGISMSTIKRLRLSGDFPPIIHLSTKRLGIRWGDYLTWQQQHCETT